MPSRVSPQGSLATESKTIPMTPSNSKEEIKMKSSSNEEDKTEDRESFTEELLMGKCTRLRHNTCFKIFVFLVVLALDAADLVSDWLLFRDVFMTKEGLVYGPPQDAIIYALLTFSIIGTFTFVFEIVNLWWEIFRGNPWINADLASAITLWVEDVPQIVLNVLIVLCRDEAISYFQLVKAAVIITGVIIRIVVSLIRYCSRSSLSELSKKDKTSRLHVCYRFLIMIALMIVFAGSLGVFFLTQFERSEDGSIKFHIPKTIFEGKFNDERYFHNVSMYFSHPLLNPDPMTPQTDEVNWMRLISIYDVRDKKTEIFKLEFDDATKTKLVIYQTNTAGILALGECYTLDRTTKTLVYESNCANLITGTKTAFIFKFEFIAESIPNLIFGDIRYNVMVKEANGICHSPTTSIQDSLFDLANSAGYATNAVVHYYRTRGVSQDHHMLWSGGGVNGAQFYRNKQHLEDIMEVWRTGYGYCTSTGSMTPHLSPEVTVDCNV